MSTDRKQLKIFSALASMIMISLVLVGCAAAEPTYSSLASADAVPGEPGPSNLRAAIETTMFTKSPDMFFVQLTWEYESDDALGFQSEMSLDGGGSWGPPSPSMGSAEEELTSLDPQAASEVTGLGVDVMYRTRAVLSASEVTEWTTVSLSTPTSKEADVPDCMSAMATAATMTSSASDSYIAATLEACASGDDWMSALEAYPEAMGAYNTTGQELSIVCDKWPNSRACLTRQ